MGNFAEEHMAPKDYTNVLELPGFEPESHPCCGNCNVFRPYARGAASGICRYVTQPEDENAAEVLYDLLCELHEY